MAPLEGVLGHIVAHKREEVAAREREVPLDELRRRAAPTTRSLRAALAQPGTRFLLEHKRASPSKGTLRSDTPAIEIARAYDGSADAMSVLTDSRFFGGSFADLRAVREATDVPLLCKDFVVSSYQVVEARSHGADAILIMLAVQSDELARACLAEARALGMDALVEVHDEAELRRAVALPAALIGINHRDLRTLAIDLSLSERLAPLVPPDRVLVAESGIETRRDVERLAPRVNAFLVGSSLMRAPDVRDAARALVFGRVKICGLTSAQDARLAAAAGATLGGVIFAPGSPRRVSLEQAAEIAAGTSLPLAGVFVDEARPQVIAVARALGLTAVQLHGDENDAYVRSLRDRLPPGCAVWKAAHVAAPHLAAPHLAAPHLAGSLTAPTTPERLRTDHGTGVARYVFDTALPRDTPTPPARGGTGLAFDWSVLAGHPHLAVSLLAGGIGPDNAVAARAVGAWALDVGSRLEARPGKKDPELLARLFERLRGPGRRPPAGAAEPPAPRERLA